MPSLIQGATVAGVARGIDCHAVREPLGVCAGITPFNFPVMVPMWMYPIAIAAGNTYVLKPSERVPRAALHLAELFKEAGLPDGVFNVVHGGAEAADALIAHPDVRAISFVGSEPVARAIYEKAGARGKRVQALSGAKNHLVVMPDCDPDKTVEGIMGAAYGSAGERCMAVSIVVAVGEAGDALVERLAETAAKLRIGEGAESEMGPLISKQHRERVVRLIEAGVKEKADLVLDGRAHPKTEGPGNFLGATLFDRVSPDMEIYREEIFGPVLSVLRVDTLEEAIAVVNANRYGNGAAIFHRQRRGRPAVPERGERGHGGDQRFRAGAARLFPFLRVEEFLLRRPPHPWAGRRELLHRNQGRHHPLVRGGGRGRAQHDHLPPVTPPVRAFPGGDESAGTGRTPRARRAGQTRPGRPAVSHPTTA